MEAKIQPNLEQGNVAVLAYNPLNNLIRNLCGAEIASKTEKEKHN